jgi:hypothetical protein
MPRERTAISNRENSIGQSAQKRTCWSKRSASRTCRAVMSVRSAISTPLESLSATALRTISTNNFLTSLTPSVPFAWCAERTKFYISRRLTHNCRNYNNYCSYCNPRGRARPRLFKVQEHSHRARLLCRKCQEPYPPFWERLRLEVLWPHLIRT